MNDAQNADAAAGARTRYSIRRGWYDGGAVAVTATAAAASTAVVESSGQRVTYLYM